MVSKNHQNNHNISIPADWGIPKFHLAQRVQIRTVLRNKTQIQTGEIRGIEYIKADSLLIAQHGIKPGWYYAIEIDPDDPSRAIDPVIHVEESEISLPDRSFLIRRLHAPASR